MKCIVFDFDVESVLKSIAQFSSAGCSVLHVSMSGVLEPGVQSLVPDTRVTGEDKR